MINELVNHQEAETRAHLLRLDPKVRAWLKKARNLFKNIPEDVWIYWQEDTMNLMACGSNGERYINGLGENNRGSDQTAVIDSITVPGSDAGAW